MLRPPHDNEKGVFTWQVITDMIIYDLLMGTLTLFTFVIIVYGAGEGNLGHDCNRAYSDSCNVVFRARAAVFAELTWLILISAWEIKSIRRSMFRLDLHSKSKFLFFRDVYANRFLFYAAVIGALIVFPCVYTPGFNTTVFKHKPISLEWALLVGAAVIFVAGMELWKLAKRTLGWFKLESEEDEKQGSKKTSLSLKQGFFSFSKSFSRTTSLEKRASNGDSVMMGQAGVDRDEEQV